MVKGGGGQSPPLLPTSLVAPPCTFDIAGKLKKIKRQKTRVCCKPFQEQLNKLFESLKTIINRPIKLILFVIIINWKSMLFITVKY